MNFLPAAELHKLFYDMIQIRKSDILLVLILTMAGCNMKTNINARKDKHEHMASFVLDTTPKVTGIGGILFISENPQKTRTWYGENLGLAINQYGSPFEFRNANRPAEINYLEWSPLKKGTKYLEPSKKEFMINYRVQKIEALVKKLRENGVTIVDTIEKFDYGKFVHIMDPDGNKIELWEPVDSILTKMGTKTTK